MQYSQYANSTRSTLTHTSKGATVHTTAAQLRHRELTQELYNIGDEVADYIEHLAEAVADYDGDLALKCLDELADIVADARRDSRHITRELLGLRQALTSGVRAGVLSGAATSETPVLDTCDALGDDEVPSDGALVRVDDIHLQLQTRTDRVVAFLHEVAEFVLENTDLAARQFDAEPLPHMYTRAGGIAEIAVRRWVNAVCGEHPAFARTMRGTRPPAFLAERARVNAVVAKVAAKRSRRGA